MIRFLLLSILVLLVARAFWRVFDGVLQAASGKPRSRPPTRAARLLRDPVCGTFVMPGTAVSVTRSGASYHFCSERCRDAFLEDPSRRSRPHAS